MSSPRRTKFSLGREHILQALLLAHHLLGFLGIRPEIRVGGLFLDFG